MTGFQVNITEKKSVDMSISNPSKDSSAIVGSKSDSNSSRIQSVGDLEPGTFHITSEPRRPKCTDPQDPWFGRYK